MKPLVSYIVPCYNQGPFLAETLDSISNQQYDNWECIVVNDGGTDNTEEIATRYAARDPRFKYHYKTNGGLSSARNFGIRASKGEYILPLDSDDLISPDYTPLAIEHLQKKPQVKIVYCMAEMFGDKNGPWNLPEFNIEQFAIENQIFCTAFYRRKDFDETDGYDEEMIYGWEDWAFWISMLKSGGEVYRIPKVCFYYRVRTGSMVRQIDAEKQAYLRRIVYRKHSDFYTQFFSDPISLFSDKKRLASDYQRLSGNFFIKVLRKLGLVKQVW